ncbi:MAG: zf-HC2 domain-containing protein, partial [Acidobacteriota bacterium]
MTERAPDAALPIEQLSAYLDAALPPDEMARIEAHLARSPATRDRLGGLRRAAEGVRRLERLAPPPRLEHAVARRIALDQRPESLLDQLERQLARFVGPPPLLLIFATIIALAVIVVLFAIAVRPTTSQPPIHLQPVEAGIEAPGAAAPGTAAPDAAISDAAAPDAAASDSAPAESTAPDVVFDPARARSLPPADAAAPTAPTADDAGSS